MLAEKRMNEGVLSEALEKENLKPWISMSYV